MRKNHCILVCLKKDAGNAIVDTENKTGCGSFDLQSQNYGIKVTLVGPSDAENKTEAVLLNVFKIAFPASISYKKNQIKPNISHQTLIENIAVKCHLNICVRIRDLSSENV